ncbi:hypothetical protein CL621_03285 [archaeon]|nr:hypothetical protein [archaeon]
MIGKRGVKRGQITTWIILGIVILTAIGGTILVKNTVLKSEWDKNRERAAKVPQQIVPVKDYIDGCISTIGKDAINMVGMQGGYVDIPGFKLTVFPNGALEVPYWYYQKENGIDVVNIPPFDDMGREISNYVNSELQSCFDNFRSLRESGYRITTGDIKTITEIGDEKIFLTLDFPVRIEFKGLTFNMDKHYNSFDVNLGKLYKLANKIIERASEDVFLEEQTIDFLVLYDEIPFSGSELRCSPKIWLKEDVIRELREILANNIPFTKIKGTSHSFPNRFYNRFLWDIGVGGYSGIRSDFMFSRNWLIDLDVFPRKGNVLKSESVTGNLGSATGLAQSFLCLQNYHFIYDIKYPILIKLIDDSSFNGEGYTFQFASQVVIDNNQPRRSVIVPESIQEGATRYCDKRFVDSAVYTYEKDLDGNLRPLSDVRIGYRCINHFCDIGKTEFDVYDEASLRTEFPSCINGEIVAEKEGYHLVKEQVSTNNRVEIPLILEPYVVRKSKVKVINKGGSVRSLLSSEKVIMQLIENDKDYSTSVIYPDNEDILLIPGDYTVNAFLVKEGRINIADRKVEKCIDVPKKGIIGVLGATEEKCVETTIPGGTFNNVVTGAVEFEFTINSYDLKKDSVEFYIPSKGVPKNVEDMAQITLEVPENFVYPRFLDE